MPSKDVLKHVLKLFAELAPYAAVALFLDRTQQKPSSSLHAWGTLQNIDMLPSLLLYIIHVQSRRFPCMTGVSRRGLLESQIHSPLLVRFQTFSQGLARLLGLPIPSANAMNDGNL